MRADKILKYARLAKFMADEFSKDSSTKVGALALDPQSYRILATGYNGFPHGIDESIPERWERPIKYEYVEHAERNVIYNAAAEGIALKGAALIVTALPCTNCARGVIQTRMSRVITWRPDEQSEFWQRWKDSFNLSLSMFKEAGVEVVFLDDISNSV